MMEAANQPKPGMTDFSAYIERLWGYAKDAKRPIERQMLKNMRQRHGVYEADKLSAIKQMGGSEIFVLLTMTKCRAAEAWINDILRPIGERPWSIRPTPIPELPADLEESIKSDVAEVLEMVLSQFQTLGMTPNLAYLDEEIRRYESSLRDEMTRRIKEEAKTRAERMALRIDDKFSEGGWHAAFWAVISDMVTLKAGILKGPVVRRRKTTKWVQEGGRWQVRVQDALVTEWDRVSPFDYYPAPDSRGAGDGYKFERHMLTRSDLTALIGAPGYSEPAIRKVLAEYGYGGGKRETLPIDAERAMIEFQQTDSIFRSDKIEAHEFWGNVQGRHLLEWGVAADLDPEFEYEANVWRCGTEIIKAVLNPDKLGRHPYSADSYERVPGAFWGKGVPELMSDLQDVCNAIARAIVNNAGLASGPQVEVNADRCDDSEAIWPWKIWQTTNRQMIEAPAVRFNQPTLIVGPLLQAFQAFSAMADEQTNIPRWTHGNSDIGGAGQTSSGLSMLMTSSSRGIKETVSHIDTIIASSVERQYYFLMIYDEDESIKGDCKIIAAGSASILAREQRMIRTTEFMQATLNPLDSQIIGIEGRAKLLREWATMLEVDISDILPGTEDELRKLVAKIQAAEQQRLALEANAHSRQLPAPRTVDAAGAPSGGTEHNLFPNKEGRHP